MLQFEPRYGGDYHKRILAIESYIKVDFVDIPEANVDHETSPQFTCRLYVNTGLDTLERSGARL